MKVSFRQGLISYQADGFGLPQYLTQSTTPGYVGLNVAPTPCVVAFAHGSSDYLKVFASSVTAAWGPVVPGATSYLYWDIDLLTANVTYGLTTLEPAVGPTPPASPPNPNGPAVFHWFDTSTATMKIWKGTSWQNVVRAFAGRVNGSVNSITAEPRGQSWRSALPVDGNPGYISTDVFGNPLRTPAGEFVTSTTPVRFKTTSGTSGVLAVLPNAYIPVRASENIPAMSLVYFSGENSVGLASGNPAIVPSRIPIGVVQDELSLNEVGNVTQSGEISYDQWDWSAHIGKPLYCGDTGEIVTHRPAGLLAYRIGFVKDSRTILFQVDAETLPQVYQASVNNVIISGTSPIETSFTTNGIGERIWTVAMAPATSGTPGHMTAAQAALLQGFDGRITAAEEDILNRAVIGHTHTIPNITGLQDALDGKSPVGHNHDLQYAQIDHNHDGYHAPLIHQHTIPDVSGLQNALNLKVNTVPTAQVGNLSRFAAAGQIEDAGVTFADFAFANHTHAISNVTGLQAALDSKAAADHTHTLGELTDVILVEPVTDQVLRFNGVAWVNGDGATAADTIFTFQVGVPTADHLHYVPVLASQVRDLIHGTSTALPVGDPGQAVLVVTSDLNGPVPHTHSITLVYDYIRSTLRVVDISNNGTDQHTAYLVGSARAHEGEVLFGSELYGYTSSSNFRFDSFSANFEVSGMPETASIRTENFALSSNGGNVLLSGGSGAAAGGSVQISGGQSQTATGGDLVLHAGDGVSGGGVSIMAGSGGTGSTGDVSIVAGAAGVGAIAGGTVYISGGTGFDGLQPPMLVMQGVGTADLPQGSFTVSTGGQTRLSITMDGAFEVASNSGSVGQVLMSNGAGGPPTWADSVVEAFSLAELSDVSLANAPDNRDALVYDSNTERWIAEPQARVIKPAPMSTLTLSIPSTYEFGSALHHNYHIRSTSATDIEIDIPADTFWSGSDQYFDDGYNPGNPGHMPNGGSLLIGKHGAGNVTITAGPGVVINTPDTLMITKLHGKAMLIKVGPNEWDIEGNIGA